VHENIFAAIVTNDKAKALLSVEEFYDACAFANDLRRHAAPAATACAAAKAATAAKAAATAKTIAAAESVSTAAETITTTKAVTTAKAIKAALAETVALVFATPAAISAAPFIETHVPVRLPGSPTIFFKNLSVGRQTQAFGRYAQSRRHCVIS
jgi:hypothetical protein